MSLESALRLTMYAAALLSGIAFGVGWVVGYATQRGTKKGMNAAVITLLVFVAIHIGLQLAARSPAQKYDVQVQTFLVSGNAIGVVARMMSFGMLFALATGLFMGRRKQVGKGLFTGLTVAMAALCVICLGNVFSVSTKVMAGAKELGIGQGKPKEEPNANQGSAENLKSLYTAFSLYAQDWDALPPAKDWMSNEDWVSKVQKDEWLHNPAISNRTDDKFGYAYNEAVAEKELKGKPLNEQPDAANTPLVYESSKTEKSAFDKFESANGLVLYLNGTVKPKP
jgi:hypothetical protein